MIRTKRIYEPGEIQDGNRVLVMRLWPRGIRKETVDLWLRDLGADPANIKKMKELAIAGKGLGTATIIERV